MWDALKNALTGAKDLLGIEVPEIPVPEDLASAAGDATGGAQDAVAGVTESATSAVEGAATTGEALTGQPAEQLTAVTEAIPGTAAAAVQSSAQTVTQAAADLAGAAGR